MKKWLFISCLSVIIFPSQVFAQSEYPKPYQSEVQNEINAVLNPAVNRTIGMDESLCELAEKLAQDNEDMAPESVTGSLFSNPRYKDLIQNYKSYDVAKINKNHFLLEFEEKNGGVQPFDVESAIKAFADTAYNGILLDPKYNYGCVAISEGTTNPIMLYIGAEMKIENQEDAAQKKSFWEVIKRLWSSWWSYN